MRRPGRRGPEPDHRSVIGTAFADAFGTDTTTAATASPDSVGVPAESLPPDPPAYEAVASDFSITLKVKSRDCFGDAGCNVTYVPVLTIVGSQVDQDAGSYSITYEVRGGTDGAEVDTIDVASGRYDQSEGFAQTARASSKLTAVITDVETDCAVQIRSQREQRGWSGRELAWKLEVN